MQGVFLRRGLISLGLWIAMMAGAVVFKGSVGPTIFLLSAIALAVILGKVIMQAVADATGFNFFFSIWGLAFFYALVASFAIVIAPIYATWMFIKFLLAKRAEGKGAAE